jgi:hypothetical protein
MKKLRLSLDELAVDTFTVSDDPRSAGTVQGNSAPEDAAAITGWSWLCGSCDGTCDGGATCPVSCAGASPTYCNGNYCKVHPPKDGLVEGEAGVPAGPANPYGY